MRFTSITAVTAATLTTLAFAASSGGTAQAAPSDVTTKAEISAASTSVRFATFNVRTARADRGTHRSWLNRANSVAREIISRNPGIVSIQELGPGRADGKKTKLNGAMRQTESLDRALANNGGGKYKLTRYTAYVAPGTSHGTQGARILYDSNQYRLVSNCPETTGKSNYNGSCSMNMPIKGSDPKSDTRSAAYAEFEDRDTGKNFWVISVHLDTRHGGVTAERSNDNLRESQVAAVYDRVAGAAGGEPILFGGDLNSWRTKAGRHAPFDYLRGKGFVDGTTAPNRIDDRYPTVNHFKTTLKANAPGRQVALDVVMARGADRFTKYENVMKVSDSSRPSDHNLVYADLVI